MKMIFLEAVRFTERNHGHWGRKLLAAVKILPDLGWSNIMKHCVPHVTWSKLTVQTCRTPSPVGSYAIMTHMMLFEVAIHS